MLSDVELLDAGALRRALALRDLTDPAEGPHALQALVACAVEALRARWGSRVVVHRAAPVVPVADNYDRLHYPEGGAARDARYTRYVTRTALLRTQTSAMIPSLLRVLAGAEVEDLLLACPGLVYRRDAIDRLHTGEPHQLDLWRVARRPLDARELREMIAAVVEAALPGRAHRATPASHPYTREGLQIDVAHEGGWIEIGECGLASPDVLAEAGLGRDVHGLAMGLGLDRLLMLRKGVDDIRLLRSEDPRVAAQMLDLAPYRPVSQQPAARRDLSIAVDEGDAAEELGDRVRAALGDRAACVEAVEVLASTPYGELPDAARARLGMAPTQKNLLVRVTLRDLARSLSHEEANELRDDIYEALHRGAVRAYAGRRGAAGREPGGRIE